MALCTLPANVMCVLFSSRFDNEGGKIESPVIIDKFVFIGDATYKFISGVIHKGPESCKGHYTCLALRSDGGFVHIDDAIVSSIF